MAKSVKFNMQNMPRKPVYGVDFRGLLRARPGKILLVCDWDQIEARLLLWRVGDTAFIKLLEREGNLYQAYARQQGTFHGKDLKEEDPDLYQYSKACVLSLGYGCGWRKFQATAKATYGITLSDAQAEEAVKAYRNSNPRVCAFWREHQEALLVSAMRKDAEHSIRIASGRSLTYFNPHALRREDPEDHRPEVVAQFLRGGPMEKVYGGLLVENEIQATARDVLRDAWLAADKQSYQILFSVHDELVTEVDAGTEEEHIPRIKQIAKTAATWAKGAPLSVSIKATPQYVK